MLPARIGSKIVRTPSGCWEWTGTHNTHGYGMVWWVDRMRVTHAVVYLILVGTLPHGLEHDHLCENKGCCNPSHLEPVTHAENMRRASNSRAARALRQCHRGHLFTTDNTYRTRRGGRCCRACRRINQNALNQRKKTHALSTPNDIYGEPEAEARAIIETALLSAGAKPLDPDTRFHVVTVPAGGESRVIDLEQQLEAFRPTPRRKSGAYTVYDVESFVAYFGKHCDPESEVWADPIGGMITAVLDANMAVIGVTDVGARWEAHRLLYPARLTEEWTAWAAKHDTWLDQTEFAEHLEDRLGDIVEPSGADMLELAQSFQATNNVSFESSKRLQSGERQLEYKETIDARAGHTGNITVPEKFYLALRPYEGSDKFKVESRFRYRINNGKLLLGYKITNPVELLREAFDSLVADINTKIDESDVELLVPVLVGQAPPARR